MKLYSRLALAFLLSAGMGANAQDVTSDTAKAAKATEYAAAKATEATGHGTEKAVKKTAGATGHAARKAAHGVKKGVKGTAHELKGDPGKPTSNP